MTRFPSVEKFPLDLVIKDLPLKLLVISQDGEILFANKDMLGLSRSELLGKPLFEIFDESSSFKVRKAFSTALLSNSECKLSFSRKEGSPISIRFIPTYANIRTKLIACIVTEEKTRDVAETERFKVPDKLFRALADQSLLGILLVIKDGVAYANPAYAEIVGRSLEEIYSLKPNELWELIHPDDRHGLKERYRQFRKEAKLHPSSLYRVLRPNGEVRWVEASVSILETDQHSGMLRTLADVTDRVMAERELHKERDRAHMYLELARVIFLVLDENGKVSMINRKGLEVLGYSEEEVIGHEWFEFVEPESREEVEANFNRLIAGEEDMIEDFERTVVAKSGKRKLIAWNTTGLRDTEGNIVGVISSGEDVTEKRNAEQELVERERKIRTLLQSLHDMVFVISPSKKFIEYHARDDNELYRPPNEFLGRSIKEVFPEPLASTFEATLDEVIKTRQSRTEDYTLEIGGSPRWYSAIISPHSDGENIVAVVRDITERQKAQQEKEEAYRIINMSSIVAFVWRNEEGWPVEFVTANVTDLFGYSAQEWITGAIDYASVIHPDDLSRVASEVKGFSADRLCESFTHEPYRIITKDGIVRWVSDNTVICRNSEGNITHYQGIVSDITKEHEALSKIKRERASFRKIAAAAIRTDDAISLAKEILKGLLDTMELEIGSIRLYDEKRGILKTAASVGLPRELETSNPSIDTDSNNHLVAHVAKSRKRVLVPDIKENPQYADFKNIAKMHLQSFIVSPLFNEGALVGTFAAGSTKPNRVFLEDIEFYAAIEELLASILEKKYSEQAYQMSIRRYQELLTDLTEGIAIVNLDEQYVFVNQAFCDILGYEKSEILGRDSKLDVHPDDIPVLLRETEARKMGAASSYRLRLIRKDGSVRITRVSAIPSRNDFGEIEGAVALISDITDRVRAEEEVKALNIELAERVSDRTAELEAAVKELESFAYTVSHDLRAPLRIIDGFSQAIIEDYSDSLDEVGKDFLNRIRSGVTNMSRLIDDILAFSRVARVDMDKVEVNLSRLAEEVVYELRSISNDRKIDVSIQPDVIARCDKRLARIVLHNLLENSWKFTSKVDNAEISFGAEEQNGQKVFFVKDNGVGFNPQEQEKLFKPFNRLHKSDEFEGSGIGLATVTRIITKHGGNIWAEGEEGKGATFYFTFE